MYSLALLVAMNASVPAPGTCLGSGHACIGTTACHGHGLFSGHGCHGFLFGGHKLFGGHCLGACHGTACHGTACHGGHRLFNGHGCHGFLFGGHKLFGGCHGCLGVSCYGGQPMPTEKVPVKPTDKKTELYAPANLIVTLPADAKLSIDEAITSSTGTVRSFVTPELERGKTYYYTLKAEITRDGKAEIISREVEVRAGEATRVMIEAPATATVSR